MSEQELSTRSCILEAARSEFLEKGYQGASLREIAKRAGVTTGALYGYFAGKSKLFAALVKKPYNYTLELYRDVLSDFFALPAEQQQADMIGCTHKCMMRMVDYMYAHYDSFKLILCCSQGTPYASMVHELAHLDVLATQQFRSSITGAGVPLKPVNKTLEHMLTSGMFSTFFELIVHDIPRKDADEYVRQMLDFYSAGWQKIMGF